MTISSRNISVVHDFLSFTVNYVWAALEEKTLSGKEIYKQKRIAIKFERLEFEFKKVYLNSSGVITIVIKLSRRLASKRNLPCFRSLYRLL